MPYGFKIELDSTDITDKVSRFEVLASLNQYCREISLELADPDYYDTFDFSTLPESPVLEIFTRIDTDWVSQGTFFIERPTYTVGIHRTTTGIWGRSLTALLGPPFAPKVRKIWDEDTTFLAVCEEMCDLVGLSWDASYADIDDFMFYAYTYQADGLYPAEVLSELLQLAYGDDGYLATDRAGHVCVRRIHRSPATADHTITDLVTVSISEEPEWPDFGNRVKISASGSVGGYSVAVSTPTQCLNADGETRAKIYARVTDADGSAMTGVPVTWSTAGNMVTLDRTVSATRSMRIPDEHVRASNYTEVTLAFAPASIVGMWAYNDIGRSNNLAEDGYTVSGNTVTLTTALPYCDQLLRVAYISDGVAVNRITTGTEIGTEKVTAELGGNTGSVDLYLGNPCQCPPSISLQVRPSTIKINEWAALLAYVEIAGAPVTDGRSIYMTIDSLPSHGHLQWTRASLGTVAINEEQTRAQNDVSGVTQCEVSMFPDSVDGVWVAEEDADGDPQKSGSNIYSSHEGKLINLTEQLDTDTELLVDYVAVGAAINTFDGVMIGTDRIRAMLVTTREERTEASVTVMVTQDGESSDDVPDCCNDGLCKVDIIPCGESTVDCASSGGVYGMSGGAPGCYSEEELDSCGSGGNVYCYKDGGLSCVPVGECDTSAATALIRCISEGVDGCFDADECDACGDGGNVYCFKSGVLGCYAPSECDAGTGGADEVECGSGTVCCKNKLGLSGCWPSDQCSSSSGDGDGKKDEWPPDKKKRGTQCVTSDLGHVVCGENEVCCEKAGKRACWPWDQCDKRPDYCYSTDCHRDPTDACLASRFGKGLQDGGDGCSCGEMCDKEFRQYGTTQSYDGSSYRSVAEIVNSLYGYAIGSPEFYEKYEELKAEALDACGQDCGDCEAFDDLELTGDTHVTAGRIKYTATGGKPPYTWNGAGTGITMDSDGYLNVSDEGCGTFLLTVEDACGRSAEIKVASDKGEWALAEDSQACTVSGNCSGSACNWTTVDVERMEYAGNLVSGDSDCASSCGCIAWESLKCCGVSYSRWEWVCPGA